jgi:hypothetical protein
VEIRNSKLRGPKFAGDGVTERDAEWDEIARTGLILNLYGLGLV